MPALQQAIIIRTLIIGWQKFMKLFFPYENFVYQKMLNFWSTNFGTIQYAYYPSCTRQEEYQTGTQSANTL